MEVLIIGLIGMVIGFTFNWTIALGCIVVIVIILLFLNYSELDGIGSMILVIFASYFICGILVGMGINYLSGYVNLDNKKEKELPELICKIENQMFYVKEYEYKEGIIINLKTDQVFKKENCSLH